MTLSRRLRGCGIYALTDCYDAYLSHLYAVNGLLQSREISLVDVSGKYSVEKRLTILEMIDKKGR